MSSKNPMRMLSILGAMAAVSSLMHEAEGPPRPNRTPNEDKKSLETEQEKAQRLGLRQWDFQGTIVYAATRKAALKKLKKITK